MEQAQKERAPIPSSKEEQPRKPGTCCGSQHSSRRRTYPHRRTPPEQRTPARGTGTYRIADHLSRSPDVSRRVGPGLRSGQLGYGEVVHHPTNRTPPPATTRSLGEFLFLKQIHHVAHRNEYHKKNKDHETDGIHHPLSLRRDRRSFNFLDQ